MAFNINWYKWTSGPINTLTVFAHGLDFYYFVRIIKFIVCKELSFQFQHRNRIGKNSEKEVIKTPAQTMFDVHLNGWLNSKRRITTRAKINRTDGTCYE